MRECCEIRSDVPARQRRVLQVVLVINALFLVELLSGVLAHSTALLADSVDMLGDAIVYGFSRYVVSRGAVWPARAALPALLANAACLLLLWRHRTDDVNMRSAWRPVTVLARKPSTWQTASRRY